MRKIITLIIIILIFLPMLIYLNPFIWGMRKEPHYSATHKTKNLLSNLNQKYKLKIEIGEMIIDTLWYFRDFKHNKISKLKNFELNISKKNEQNVNFNNVEDYVKEFNESFEHKKYFDSIKVITDSKEVIYKTNIK